MVATPRVRCTMPMPRIDVLAFSVAMVRIHIDVYRSCMIYNPRGMSVGRVRIPQYSP